MQLLINGQAEFNLMPGLCSYFNVFDIIWNILSFFQLCFYSLQRWSSRTRGARFNAGLCLSGANASCHVRQKDGHTERLIARKKESTGRWRLVIIVMVLMGDVPGLTNLLLNDFLFIYFLHFLLKIIFKKKLLTSFATFCGQFIPRILGPVQDRHQAPAKFINVRGLVVTRHIQMTHFLFTAATPHPSFLEPLIFKPWICKTEPR